MFEIKISGWDENSLTGKEIMAFNVVSLCYFAVKVIIHLWKCWSFTFNEKNIYDLNKLLGKLSFSHSSFWIGCVFSPSLVYFKTEPLLILTLFQLASKNICWWKSAFFKTDCYFTLVGLTLLYTCSILKLCFAAHGPNLKQKEVWWH